MDPNVKSFSWHLCEAVRARSERKPSTVRRT